MTAGSGGGGNDDTTTAATVGNNYGGNDDMDDGRAGGMGCRARERYDLLVKYDFQFLLPMDEVGYFGVICVAGKV